jgi:hypothetical protein
MPNTKEQMKKADFEHARIILRIPQGGARALGQGHQGG